MFSLLVKNKDLNIASMKKEAQSIYIELEALDKKLSVIKNDLIKKKKKDNFKRAS